MGMSSSEYNYYARLIKDIVSNRTKEALIAVYRQILVRTGDLETLKELDRRYNSRWSIDLDRL